MTAKKNEIEYGIPQITQDTSLTELETTEAALADRLKQLSVLECLKASLEGKLKVMKKRESKLKTELARQEVNIAKVERRISYHRKRACADRERPPSPSVQVGTMTEWSSDEVNLEARYDRELLRQTKRLSQLRIQHGDLQKRISF
jgi:hypothetical protein